MRAWQRPPSRYPRQNRLARSFASAGEPQACDLIPRLPISLRILQRNAKLEEQCEIVAELIVAMRPLYQSASVQQRALLETIIGAALWYIPKPPRAWTGRISVGALRAFHPASGIEKPRLSEEHVYPRKVTAKLLLRDESLSGISLATLFREKYGRVHFITSEENKTVQPFQRASVFTSPDDAYEKARIAFLELSDEDLRKVKRRDGEVIERHLRTGEQGVLSRQDED